MEPQRVQVGSGSQTVAHAHRFHRPMNDSLVQCLQVGRHLGDTLGDLEHSLIQFVGGEGAVGHAGGDGLVTTDRVAGQHRLHRAAHAGQPHVPRHVRRAHRADRRVADLRVVSDIDQIARRGQLGAAGQAVAVHLSDDRRGQVHDLEPALQHVARPRSVGPRDRPRRWFGRILGEVVARREARPGAADDDDAHRSIGIGGAEGVEQLGAQPVRQRVALVRPVERQSADGRGRIVDQHQWLGHSVPCLESKAGRWVATDPAPAVHRQPTSMVRSVTQRAALRSQCAEIRTRTR